MANYKDVLIGKNTLNQYRANPDEGFKNNDPVHLLAHVLRYNNCTCSSMANTSHKHMELPWEPE